MIGKHKKDQIIIKDFVCLRMISDRNHKSLISTLIGGTVGFLFFGLFSLVVLVIATLFVFVILYILISIIGGCWTKIVFQLTLA